MRKRIRRIVSSERTLMIGIGLVVGIATGYGAIACRLGIEAIRWLAFGEAGDISEMAAAAPFWLVLLLPALGGLVVAPLVELWAKEAKGHGIPEVMDAIARRGGRIRPRVVFVKAIASVVTIGTGGAVGWEGPIVQIGAGIGSAAGQVLRVARRHMRVLVACGAAGGIAATFNAPIAGVLFALEVFVGDLAIGTFTPVVVAAVASTGVSFHHFGGHAVFDLPEQAYRLNSVVEIPLYALLGVACAVGAVLFTRMVYFSEDGFESARIPRLLKPALGGLAVGALGLAMPEVLGVGYSTITRAFHGEFALHVVVALFFLKLAASCLTLGSGGSGGIFAPSLVLGVLVGAGFGELAHWITPAASAGVFAVVGMAAFVAGTTHAPFSAILILVEMTKDYEIILPLMIACVLASTVAHGIFRESIYTLKLARRGVRLEAGRDAGILAGLTVRDTMRTDVTVLEQGLAFKEVRARALGSSQQLFPVLDAQGRYAGSVLFDSLRGVLFEDGLVDIAIADDLVTSSVETLSLVDDLQTARALFFASSVDELPVLDPETRRVVGLLRQHDLHAAYNHASSKLE